MIKEEKPKQKCHKKHFDICQEVLSLVHSNEQTILFLFSKECKMYLCYQRRF